MKEEHDKKQAFIQSFGNEPILSNTMSKLSILLDDFLAHRRAFGNSEFDNTISVPNRSHPTKPRTILESEKEKGITYCFQSF